MRSYVPVFQIQFALIEVDSARIKHRAQYFVRNIISNAVAQQSPKIIFRSAAGIFSFCPMPVPRFTISTVVDTEAHLKLAMYTVNLGHSVKCVSRYIRGFCDIVIFLKIQPESISLRSPDDEETV